MAKKTSPDASPVAHFEQSLDELEQLVEKMEQGDLSLDESLAAYERGVGLYRQCQAALEQAELRVRLLSDPEQPEDARSLRAPRPMAADARFAALGGSAWKPRSTALPAAADAAPHACTPPCATPCSAAASACGRCWSTPAGTLLRRGRSRAATRLPPRSN